MNLSALYLHAAAFGLFLVSVILYSVGSTLYFFEPASQSAKSAFWISYISWIVMGTLS